MKRSVLVGALVAAVIALVASAAVAVSTLNAPSSGSSMMGGSGGSMMGGPGGSGGSMMGGSVAPRGSGTSMMGGSGGSMMDSMGMVWLSGDGVAVSAIPAARARAATAAKPARLHPGEVIWFDNGFYVELKDGAGKPATEVIIDPATGSVSTEPGPAMMWNTRFGMHMNGGNTGSVNASKARSIAAAWLAANRAGTTIASIDSYPGYFTVDLRRDGRISGMLSVNSLTGALWYHAWHGTFIAMQD